MRPLGATQRVYTANLPCKCTGSRLPAPPAWPLLEVWHPSSQGPPDGSSGSSSGGSSRRGVGGGRRSRTDALEADGDAAQTVGAALTWLLGLEAAGSAYLALIPAGED